MATLSTEIASVNGLAPTFNAADGAGDKFKPSLRTFLYVKNGDAASHDATITTHQQVIGLDVADVTVSVPAGAERLIGPFNPTVFEGPDGLADITWSAITSMTVAVLRI